MMVWIYIFFLRLWEFKTESLANADVLENKPVSICRLPFKNAFSQKHCAKNTSFWKEKQIHIQRPLQHHHHCRPLLMNLSYSIHKYKQKKQKEKVKTFFFFISTPKKVEAIFSFTWIKKSFRQFSLVSYRQTFLSACYCAVNPLKCLSAWSCNEHMMLTGTQGRKPKVDSVTQKVTSYTRCLPFGLNKI